MRVDEAPIENPCDEELERMRLAPGGLERHCERCNETVHDLTAMGPERARALVAGASGPICVSYAMNRRGEIVFHPARLVPLTRLAQAAALVASLDACTPHGKEAPPKIQESEVSPFELARPAVPPDVVYVEREEEPEEFEEPEVVSDRVEGRLKRPKIKVGATTQDPLGDP